MAKVDGGDDVAVPADVRREALPEPELWPRLWLRRAEDATGFLFVLAGLALVLVRYAGSSDGLPNAGLAAAAVGLPFSALGLLAMLGGRSGRPALTATASLPLVLMCMVSAATVLLLPFAVFLAVRGVFGLAAGRQRHLGWEELCLSSVLPAAVLLAFGYLLFHQDPASWQPDEHTYVSSDNIVTVSESLLSLGAVAVTVVVSFVWIVMGRARSRSL
jgi:hypothetical protein